MRTLHIQPSSVNGVIKIPPSKSHTMRALLFGSLGEGKTRIHHSLLSSDSKSMIQALRLFGIKINVQKEMIEIEGCNGQLGPCEDVIDAGNSGLVFRLLGSLAALNPTYTVLTGDHSIRHRRPITPLLNALKELQAEAVSCRRDGKAPVFVRGPIVPGHATVTGEDSQPVSGLLIAASFLDGQTHLTVENPGETPWIDMTLSWIERLGGKIAHEGYAQYTVEGPLRYPGFEISIPGDWSSAAFPLGAALVTGSKLTCENLDPDDCQGDKQILSLLEKMGVKFDVDRENRSVTMQQNASYRGSVIDVNRCIDAIPILAVLACFAQGTTRIHNGAIARAKESDRLACIAKELSKMGAHIEELEDGLEIHPTALHGATLNSHEDHRIAMALAVAAMGAKGCSRIEGIECIAKTYPSFVEDFQKIGACMEVIE